MKEIAPLFHHATDWRHRFDILGRIPRHMQGYHTKFHRDTRGCVYRLLTRLLRKENRNELDNY